MTISKAQIRKLMKTHYYLPNHIIQKHSNRLFEVIPFETDNQEKFKYYRFPVHIGNLDNAVLDTYLNIDKIEQYFKSTKQQSKKFLLDDFSFGTRLQEVTEDIKIACTEIDIDTTKPVSTNPIIILNKYPNKLVIDGNTRVSFAKKKLNNNDILGYELEYADIKLHDLYLNEYSKRLFEFYDDLVKYYDNYIS